MWPGKITLELKTRAEKALSDQVVLSKEDMASAKSIVTQHIALISQC
jgi:hypothetical protein